MGPFFETEILGLVTVHQLIVIAHLFGLALGAGAAFFSDFLFSDAMKDRRISKDELKIIKLASRVVWIGLIVLVLSGILLFAAKPMTLIYSTKFLAKMTIIAVLVINGLIFAETHFPMLEKYVGKSLRKAPEARSQLRAMFISGAVSGVSWASALILGSLRSVDLSYLTIMSIYLLAVLVASFVGLQVFNSFFPGEKK